MKDTGQVDEGWIELWSGARFYFERESEEIAKILTTEDMVWPLSRICRYNGHSRRWYTTGEHSILLCRKARKEGHSVEIQKTFLLHDGAESFIQDLARPFKVKIEGRYKEFESKIDQAISLRFGTIYPFPQLIKEWDVRICRDERFSIMRPTDNEWGVDHLETLNIKPRCWSPWRVRWELRKELRRLGLA